MCYDRWDLLKELCEDVRTLSSFCFQRKIVIISLQYYLYMTKIIRGIVNVIVKHEKTFLLRYAKKRSIW